MQYFACSATLARALYLARSAFGPGIDPGQNTQFSRVLQKRVKRVQKGAKAHTKCTGNLRLVIRCGQVRNMTSHAKMCEQCGVFSEL